MVKYGKPYRYKNGAIAVFTHADAQGNVVGTIQDERGERRHVEGMPAFEADDLVEEFESIYSVAIIGGTSEPVVVEIPKPERGTEWTSLTTATKSAPTGASTKSRKRT